MVQFFKISFYLFLGFYIALLLTNPQFAPAEEPSYFLDTIQVGKLYPFYIDFTDARFQPLHAQEYNLVAKLFSATPLAYYLFNTIQLIIFFFIITKTVKLITKNQTTIYLILLTLLLLPGLVNVWFRMIVGERGVVFFGALFIYSYLSFLKKDTTFSNAKAYFLITLSVLFTNFAIYYKEPVFLAVIIIAGGHLILDWKLSSIRIKILETLLIISSISFVLIYFFFIYLNSDGNYAANISPASLFTTVWNWVSYIFYDPILIFLFVPIFFLRIYQIVLKKENLNSVYDPMLLASLIYLLVILALKLNAPYYLLPVYIFAIPPSLYFFIQYQNIVANHRVWQLALILAVLLQIYSAIPVAIETISQYKYLPINANQTFDLLAQDIKARYPNQRVDIFLDNIDRDQHIYLYNDFGAYLKYKGLTVENFDLKSTLYPSNKNQFAGFAKSPYTALNTYEIEPINSGDYLVITPLGYREVTDIFLKTMETEYNLIFRTYSKFAIPNFGLDRIIKHWLFKKHFVAKSISTENILKSISTEKQKQLALQAGQMFNSLVDYYVFIHK